MKNINLKILILFSFVAMFSFGCETLEDAEVEYSPVWPLSGEWWVTYKMGSQDFGGHKKLFTYNSAGNVSNEMILNGTFSSLVEGEATDLSYKIKVNSNPSERSFSISNAETISGISSNVTVENGMVIIDGGKSLSGVTTDSVYMELSFSNPAVIGLSAGDKIIVSGVRRTGWLEDDY